MAETAHTTRRSLLAGGAAAILSAGLASAVTLETATAMIRQPGATDTRRLLETYDCWLHMERRLLAMQLRPEMGAAAEDVIPHQRAAHDSHFPSGMDWRDVPAPQTRAALVLDAVGCSWRA